MFCVHTLRLFTDNWQAFDGYGNRDQLGEDPARRVGDFQPIAGLVPADHLYFGVAGQASHDPKLSATAGAHADG